MRILLLGHMGRDEALVDKLKDHELHIIGKWENPGLVEKAKKSRGKFYVIDSITNVKQVADIAEDIRPEMFITNFDDALAAGVVDAVRERIPHMLIPCPEKATSRIEWDKFYLRQLIDEIDPSYNPLNYMAETMSQAQEAIAKFENSNTQIALKPRNLTGGKGVKVMGKHFGTYTEAVEYAREVLDSYNQSGIEIQEKLTGHEFTLQIFTDGQTLIRPPVTYDFPYREDGDIGPGTGGMGTFTMADGRMPFVTNDDYEQAMRLALSLVQTMRSKGNVYKGVLYPSFFKTANGLKIVEVNARGGDPELINILDLMEDDVDVTEALIQIAQGTLKESSIKYKAQASTMIYLVSPDYAYRSGPVYEFNINKNAVKKLDVKIRFAAAEHDNKKTYRTVGSSRTVGLSALGETPWEAREKIQYALEHGFSQPLVLRYRSDVGDKDYISKLAN